MGGQDFCNANKSFCRPNLGSLYRFLSTCTKWYPSPASCHGIYGTNGELGCIRLCSGFSISSQPRARTVLAMKSGPRRDEKTLIIAGVA
ncbi:hypothetical protein REPUB_Repub03eG0032800 [Reevesia pubescens]